MLISSTFAEVLGSEAGQLIAGIARSLGRVAGLLLAALLARHVLRRIIHRVDDVRRREQLLFFVPKLLTVIVAIMSMAAVGIDVSGMAAVMATIGFTGAVIFTSVGQNLVAGAMIRIDDVYRVGEAVTIDQLHGIVVYRTMLRTELQLPDGSTAWVPNASFQDGQVLNHSRTGGWRICVEVPLDCVTDRALAHEVMNTVMEHLPWSYPHRHAFVAFDRVGSEAMFFNAYAWIDDRTQEPWFRGLLLSRLVDALEEVGVSVGQTTNLSLGATRREGSAPQSQ
jgi:small-conductance mechanosensitive channel